MDLGKEEKKKTIFDLNLPAEECPSGIGLGFQDFVQLGSTFLEKQTENRQLVDDSGGGGSSGGDLRRMEREPDFEMSDSRCKRMRYSIEEKGKAKVDYFGKVNLDVDLNLDLWGWEKDPIQEQVDNRNAIDVFSSMRDGPEFLNLGPVEHNFLDVDVEQNQQKEEIFVKSEDEEFERRKKKALSRAKRRVSRRKEQRELARDVAQRFAHLDPEEQKQEKKIRSREVHEELDDSQSPFSLAMEAIKKRQSVQKRSWPGLPESLFKWVPANKKECNVLKRDVPSLLDLSLNALAKNADAIVSLEHVPDVLRHKLSQLVSDSRKVDAHFVELLVRGSPTEIRVRDISQLTEEDFTKIFGGCDTKDLTVLQLDLCGRCMPDYVLHDTLARSSHKLSVLAAVSLRGAHRLSDTGLTDLTISTPALQSINLSQCSLLTSNGIYDLAIHFESTLRELYIDDCQNIDAMIILPALKRLKCLEVLSVAGIQTVSDEFVIGMVKICGPNMKELVFANCPELTDTSLKIVGENCPKLCALDLSYLRNLTDSALQHLANGCRSIRSLKLCRNDFSDEAIAAFLEASGKSLNVLSLNNIRRVSLNTALSISKCLRNLWSLDLSWCRKLTDEALGLIVDNCLSLKQLKLFGCTQITDVFLDGHSNPLVQIIGCRTDAVLEHLDMLESEETPLRYSPLTAFADHQSLDPRILEIH